MGSALWSAVLVTCVASRLDAQVGPATSPMEEEAIQRLLALEAELDLARAGSAAATYAAALERVEANRKSTVLRRVGPFEVLALVEQGDLAEEMFTDVWRNDFSSVTGSPALESSTFAFEWWRTAPSEVGWTLTPAVDGPTMRRVEVSRLYVPGRDRLRASVTTAVWSALRDDFPDGSPMRDWLGYADYLPGAGAYRMLAVTPSAANRACLAGDTPACAAALGVADVAARPEWFTREEKQRMLGVAVQPWMGRADRDEPDVRACLEENVESACDRVVGRLGWVEMSTAPSSVKTHLLWYAIHVGGDSAWARAVERADANPAEVLVAVSGQPLDQLLRCWQVDLVRQRPDVHAGLAGGGLTVLFWSLVLAGFAMRSTRWRSA